MSFSVLDVVSGVPPDSTVEVMRAVVIMHYTKIGPVALNLFEYAITFDGEVELFWPGGLSFPKVIFFANRYYIIATAMLEAYATFAPRVTESVSNIVSTTLGMSLWTVFALSCKQFGLWQWLVTWLIPMITQTILIMRVYALYMSNKKILGILCTLFVACASVDIWLLATNVPRVSIVEIAGGVYCAPNLKTPHEFYRFWIPPLLFEALLCGMVGYIAIRERMSPVSMISPTRKQSIMSIMVRDSVFYFFAIAATYLTCLVWWRFSSVYLDAPIPFATAISSVLANRILINIRAAAMNDTDNLRVWRHTYTYR